MDEFQDRIIWKERAINSYEDGTEERRERKRGGNGREEGAEERRERKRGGSGREEGTEERMGPRKEITSGRIKGK